MRVIYELNINDIKVAIAEKYEVKTDKVTVGYDAENETMVFVDMSATEIPVPVPEPIEPEFEDPAPKHKRASFKPSGYKFRTDVVSYDQITDTDIVDMIGSGVTVAEVCSVYGFDQQIKYRLYKRFEKARLELASCTK